MQLQGGNLRVDGNVAGSDITISDLPAGTYNLFHFDSSKNALEVKPSSEFIIELGSLSVN